MGRPEDVLNIEPDAGLLIGIAPLVSGRVRLVAAGLDGVVRATMESDSVLPFDQLVGQVHLLLPRLLQKAGSTGSAIRGAGLLLPDPQATARDDWGASTLDDAGRGRLEETIGSALSVAGEVHGFALAERYAGNAGGSSFIYVHTDAWVRGALFLDGRLHRGLGAMAGRFGHMIVEPNGRMAGTGGRGSLNAYLSRDAILGRLAEFGRHFRSLDEASGAADDNDVLVKTVLAETGSYLGVALANAINLLDVGTVVLGGDLLRLSVHLMPAIRDMISRDVVGPLGHEAIIRPSQLGSDPVSAGAVALAMDAFLPLG